MGSVNEQRIAFVTDLDHFSVCVTCCKMQSSPFIVLGLISVSSMLEEDLLVGRFCQQATNCIRYRP